MDQVHVIRHKILVEGRSQGQVSRELGLSRNTVRKYLTQSEPKRIERTGRRRPALKRVQARLVYDNMTPVTRPSRLPE